MSIKEVIVPDIGNFKDVEVIEIMVKAGDTLAADDSIMTVESDKAAMDIPAPFAGTVTELKIKVGDKVAAGSLVLLMDTSAAVAPTAAAPVVKSFTPAATPVIANVPPPSHPAPEVPAHIAPKHRPAPVAEHAEFATGKLSLLDTGGEWFRADANRGARPGIVRFQIKGDEFVLPASGE